MTSDDGGDSARETPEQVAERRRRRRAEVFGEVLPESTTDDKDVDAGSGQEDARDRWLRGNVPPHHSG